MRTLHSDERGWSRPDSSVRLQLERWTADEEGIRAELDGWAAYLETCDWSQHHIPLMERMIQTRQLFAIRKPIDCPDQSRAERVPPGPVSRPGDGDGWCLSGRWRVGFFGGRRHGTGPRAFLNGTLGSQFCHPSGKYSAHSFLETKPNLAKSPRRRCRWTASDSPDSPLV
jgi:hypothetical protein